MDVLALDTKVEIGSKRDILASHTLVLQTLSLERGALVTDRNATCHKTLTMPLGRMRG